MRCIGSNSASWVATRLTCGISSTNPPRFTFRSAFGDAAAAIRGVTEGGEGGGGGWTRIILEKPFGHDTDSCRVLTESLSRSWSESALYRIDHYLGKEMVQNLLTLRFSNIFLSSLWSSHYISR